MQVVARHKFHKYQYFLRKRIVSSANPRYPTLIKVVLAIRWNTKKDKNFVFIILRNKFFRKFPWLVSCCVLLYKCSKGTNSQNVRKLQGFPATYWIEKSVGRISQTTMNRGLHNLDPPVLTRLLLNEKLPTLHQRQICWNDMHDILLN